MNIKSLSADDICFGSYNQRDSDKRCLSGHTHIYPTTQRHDMYDKLLNYINAHHSDEGQPYYQIPHFNDSHTAEECAAAWNGCFAEEISSASN